MPASIAPHVLSDIRRHIENVEGWLTDREVRFLATAAEHVWIAALEAHDATAFMRQLSTIGEDADILGVIKFLTLFHGTSTPKNISYGFA